jgi:hypothetical protein
MTRQSEEKLKVKKREQNEKIDSNITRTVSNPPNFFVVLQSIHTPDVDSPTTHLGEPETASQPRTSLTPST